MYLLCIIIIYSGSDFCCKGSVMCSGVSKLGFFICKYIVSLIYNIKNLKFTYWVQYIYVPHYVMLENWNKKIFKEKQLSQ